MKDSKLSIGRSIWYIILFLFILQIPVGLIVGVWITIVGLISGIIIPLTHPLISGIIISISFVLTYLIISRKKELSIKETIRFNGFNKNIYLIIPLIVIGLNILISELDNYTRTIIPITPYFEQLFAQQFGGEISIIGALISTIIIAPIIEELLMRGIILRGLANKYSIKKAIIISAVIFAIMHLNPWQFIGALIAGIVLGWIYVETKSIIPCIYLHGLFNSMPYIVSILGVKIKGYSAETLHNSIEYQPLWFNIMGIVLLVIGIYILNKSFMKSNENLIEDEIVQ